MHRIQNIQYRAILIGQLGQTPPLAVEHVLVMGGQRGFDEVDSLGEYSVSLRL